VEVVEAQQEVQEVQVAVVRVEAQVLDQVLLVQLTPEAVVVVEKVQLAQRVATAAPVS
jgi:uncharacterized protein YaiI (UPF0178 family)